MLLKEPQMVWLMIATDLLPFQGCPRRRPRNAYL